MNKLIMMQGLPASGKTTKAKEMVMSGGNHIRVNRDLLRDMLHFDVWTGKNEGVTIDVEKAIVRLLMRRDYNVIVDDTNLSEHHEQMWKTIADESNSQFAIEHIKTSVEDCIVRDMEREKPVGAHIIMQRALQYGFFDKPEKPFVLCDIDGTVADCSHRQHYVAGEKKDWKGFFSEMSSDTVRTEVVDLVKMNEDAGHEIIFVTARPERYRKETVEWLHQLGISYLTVIMRRDNDTRPDTVVKQEMYDMYFKDKYDIQFVYDDRPSVLKVWRDNLGDDKVIDVGNGIDF